MQIAVRGIYENGLVTLDEELPTRRARVLVAILEEIEDFQPSKKRELGTMKGTIKMATDFNDPIEDLKDYM